MSHGQTDGLKQVAKGGVVFGIGLFSSYFIKLIIGIVVVRFIAKDEYGLLSFGFVVANILSAIALLGIGTGLPRMIAKARDSANPQVDTGSLSIAAFSILLATSLLASMWLYSYSSNIAVWVDKPGLEQVLVPFATMITPLAIIQFLTAVFQGFQQAKPKALFQDITENLSRLILILAIIAIGFEFSGVIWAYAGAVWVACLLYIGYAVKHLKDFMRLQMNMQVVSALLLFCLPLFGVGIIPQLSSWVAVMLLGVFQSAEQVATYMAPSRLIVVLNVAITAMGFIYIPIVTRMANSNEWGEVGYLYRVTTKWVVILSLPITLFFICDADYVITGIFGVGYSDSDSILQILSLAYLIHNILGPNLITLISCGYSRIGLYSTLLSGAVAISMSILLVPEYGAEGVALGIASSMILTKIVVAITLYRTVMAHPFSIKFVALVFALLAIALAGYLLIYVAGFDGWHMHLLLLLLMYVVAFSLPFLLRDISASDIEMIGGIERRIRGHDAITRKLKAWM